MAQETELTRRSVYYVAGALTNFAKDKGWKDSDYWIFYKTNPEWDKVYFIFVAEGLKDQDPYESTKEVLGRLWKGS